jgi:protein-disulfide isomerase
MRRPQATHPGHLTPRRPLTYPFRMRLTSSLLSFAVLVLAACGTSAGSSTSAAKTSPASAPAADGEVASVDGATIRRSELEQRAESKLLSLRQQEYEIRKQILDEMIVEKLVEKEAKARGVSPSELVKAEVQDKLVAPTEAEIDTVFEGAKARLGGQTKDQVRPQIERYLQSEKENKQRTAFEDGLRSKAKVTIALDPPRVAFTVAPGEPSLGPEKAPVTIVEFADYQCPYCHRAQGTIDELITKYGPKVRFVHQDFPLESHPRAFFASRGSRCAGDQGKFWEYHRDLLKNPSDFSDADLQTRSTKLGLDANTFKTCMASEKHDAVIRAAYDAGMRVGVNSTPTFVINGRILTGARPRQQFEAIIDEELAKLAAN